jgi:hypothetical protein
MWGIRARRTVELMPLAAPTVGSPAHQTPRMPSLESGAICLASSAGRMRALGTASRCWSTSIPVPHVPVVERSLSSRTKVLLHSLVAAFNFELAVPVDDIVKVSGLVTRPALRSSLREETQLPLVVSLAEAQ